MEWGGLLRRKRKQETEHEPTATPTAERAESAPPHDANTATGQGERTPWMSGTFLAAAARLVARGEENTYTLRRVVEWATAATGACRAVLWAVENDGEDEPQLTLLAWASVDGWRPADLPALRVRSSPALLRAFRTPEAMIITTDRPLERGADWDTRLGLNPIALCASISAGETRGILAVAGLNADQGEGATFGDDARTALVACAALAAIVFARQHDERSAIGPASAALRDDTAGPGALSPPGTPTSELAATATQHTGITEERSVARTPLFDSAAMVRRLDEEIGRARRFEHPFAVLLLTIDRTEQWAEHLDEAGLVTLRAHLIEVVRASIREVDLLGSGDDDALIVLLPVSKVADALRVGERIRAVLDRRQPELAASAPLRLTISGGAVGYPDDGTSGVELLAAAAHTAAYARRMGRDQIRMRGLGHMEAPSPEHRGEAMLPEGALPSSPHQVGQVFQALLDSLTMAGDAHDQARPGHGHAVGRYARALAEACGLNPDQAQTIELAGTLHDVGKIGLPAALLGKRGELTAEERAILREQPAIGKLMLLQIPALEAIIPLVEHAHERYDGNGYPSGLRGNQIPFGSRLIAIAEGYEAMINERPYRRALSQSMAIAELSREAGGRYDPQLVDTFVRLLGLLNDTDGEPRPLEPITIATSAPGSSHMAAAAGPDLVDARDRKALKPVRRPIPSITPGEATTKGALATADTRPAEPTTAQARTPEATRASVERVLPRAATAEQGSRSAPPTPPRQTPQPTPQKPPTASEQETGEAGIEWYDDITTHPANTSTAPDEAERPDQLNVEDTILMMSQTTLLRLAELERLNKRRTGYLSLDPKRDDKS